MANNSESVVTELFQSQDYQLDKMVIISRHNIRSPLTTADSELGSITPYEWYDWTSPSGELSVKGGELENKMGEYFREYLEAAEFMPHNWVPEEGEVRFYANSLQRTLATTQIFSSAMLPVANVTVERKNEVGEVDTTFTPALRFTNPAFEEQVKKELKDSANVDDVKDIFSTYEEGIDILEKDIRFEGSQYSKDNGLEYLPRNDTELVFAVGDEISVEGLARTRQENYQYEGIQIVDIANWLLGK